MNSSDPPAEIPVRLLENIREIRARIGDAACRSGRDPAEVVLVAVTKTVSPELVRFLPAAGIADAGENRVQAAEPKVLRSVPGLRWHMIGHLQTNKAGRAVELFELVHSVDSARLVRHLARQAAQRGRIAEVLVQVNISAEGQKTGIDPAELERLLSTAAEEPAIRVRGLMGMGPFTGDPENCRPLFRGLRSLLGRANGDGWYPGRMPHLSMGMSNDFEVAVEEGATLVRIGTAIFSGVADPGEGA
jgi:pyridoxal phosphate enzyme (YggS family)